MNFVRPLTQHENALAGNRAQLLHVLGPNLGDALPVNTAILL